MFEGKDFREAAIKIDDDGGVYSVILKVSLLPFDNAFNDRFPRHTAPRDESVGAEDLVVADVLLRPVDAAALEGISVVLGCIEGCNGRSEDIDN